MAPPNHRQVFAIAWPIVLANSAVPLLGLADTAVIGNTGTTAQLGAIALGALVFSFAYWSFGFLRMGTTGFTAQAAGAKDEPEVRATLGRALILAGTIGLALVLLQRPIITAALELIGGSAEVENATLAYYSIRIWGAPASLATFAVMGTFIGLGKSNYLLFVQVLLNALNIGLDVLFAGKLGWGVRGVALGTMIAEWTALALSLVLVRGLLSERRRDAEPFWPWERIREAHKVWRTLGANADIMIRTLLLLFGFAWFTDQGATFGDTILAANHILLQFISLSAQILDGYAFAAEALVGRALGASDTEAFDGAVRSSTRLAAATALVLAAGVRLLGPTAIDALTDLAPVRRTAVSFLPYAAVYVLVSFPAFQLDGIFIGATRTRDMRNAAVVSIVAFLGAWWVLVRAAANDGLWFAFIMYVVARAAALGVRFPALRRAIGRSVRMGEG